MKKVVLTETPINMKSTNPEDFIAALNALSAKVNGLRNLGVFADIISIEHTHEVVIDAANEYVSVDVVSEEKPRKTLTRKDESSDPRDFSFSELLGGIPPLPAIPNF